MDFGHKVKILKGSKLGGNNKLYDNIVFGGRIGKYFYIGSKSFIIANISRFFAIGSYVKTIKATYPIREFTSTYPAFYSMNL